VTTKTYVASARLEVLIIKEKIEKFLLTNPSYSKIEQFYIHEILPYDKRSINEILSD
jgi:hypothetical protein